MIKKIISALLSLLLLQSILPPVHAQNHPLQIRTPEDLITLSACCVSDQYSAGLTVELMNDLTLDSRFVPIPLFQGTFDGHGHTISGLVIDGDVTTCGLFRQVLENGTVRNLHVSGEVTPSGSGECVGGIVGKNSGTLSACSFSGTVSGKRSVGGIAGCNTGTGRIEGTSVTGKIDGQHKAGGIVGENAGIISGCSNAASVGTTDPGTVSPEEIDLTLSVEELVDITDIGGIAGFSSGRVCDSVNRGDVGYLHIGYNIGGIVGRQSGIITDCRNEAFIHGRKDVGGILGQLDPDAQWRIDNSALNTIKTQVNELNAKMNVLLNDAQSVQNGLSTGTAEIQAGIRKASDSAHSLASSTEKWANENIAAVNSITKTVSDTIKAAAPISKALGDFVNALPPVMTALAEAAEHAAAASGDTSGALADFNTALGSLDSAADNIQAATDKISAGIAALSGITSPAELPAAVANAAAQVQDGLQEVQKALDDFGTALDALETAAGQLSSGAAEMQDTMNALKTAFQKANAAQADLSSALGLTTALLQSLSNQKVPSFSGVQVDSAAQQDFFGAINEIDDALGHISGAVTDTRLTADIRAVCNDLTALVTSVLNLFLAPEPTGDLVEDISASADSQRTNGIVTACTNTGDIIADTNVGGIIGSISIDLSFDKEDDLNLSGALSGSAKYLIYASVSDCLSYAATSAVNAAGGIVGRMDYGMVQRCVSSGKITASEQYSGGIAGYSNGVIDRCMSRPVLGADRYCGGIAGLGSSIQSCLAMPAFTGSCEYMGSIAGNAEGEISGNSYAQSAVGGIDGFSFAEQAECVSYDRLLELAGQDSVFETVTVTFVVDDAVLSQIDIPFGGHIEQLPEVAPDGQKVWQWDSFDNTHIFESMEVSGHYVGAISTISTGETIPLFLAEGSFTEEQTLSAVPFDYDDSSTAVCLAISNVSPDEQFTFRMRAPSGGKLYSLEEDGTLTDVPYARDGSYLTFDGHSGIKLIYQEAAQSPLPHPMVAAVLLGALSVGGFLLVRKGRKHHPPEENSAEGENESE